MTHHSGSDSVILWGKISLLLGLGLVGLVVVEVGHKAIGAQNDADHRAIATPATSTATASEAPPANAAPAPASAAIITDAPTTNDLTTKTAPISDPTAVESSGVSEGPARSPSTLQDKTVAINSAPDDGQHDPQIAALSPEQVAIAAWAGASFPVENFQAYTSPFGYRRSPTGGYRQEFHYGLDIAAPQGSYIRSWWSGRVVEVSDHTNCGTSVVVESGEWLHIYCHMLGRVAVQDGARSILDRDAGLQIWEGQEITAGDRIGRVGMTGRTTGPHLHWGLKYQGNWVDPAWVLRAMAVSQQAMGQP